MADISFATEQSPEAVAAQVRQEQEEAQRKATDEYLATPTADHVQPSVASGALPLPPGFVGYLLRGDEGETAASIKMRLRLGLSA